MKMYDIIVVGMGPAGAVAATELGRAGFSVLGLEWKALPRYKVCGGGLSARIDPLLDSGYRDTIEETIYAVRFQFAGAEPFQVASPDPVAYMVMRDRFDAHLVQHARANGVIVREEERVVAVAESLDGITVQTGQGCYRGRILVGADGANSLVARSLFSDSRRPLMSAVEGEATTYQRPAALEAGMIVLDIGVLKGGYAWVFPKTRNLSIGAAGFREGGDRVKEGYERLLRDEVILRGVAQPLRRGHPIPVYAGEMSEPLRLTTRNALLVGDAAHLVDPLFGEGIYYAVLSGRMAARSIADRLRAASTDLSSYEQQIARTIYPEFRIAARIAWVLYTFPRVFHRIVRRRHDIIQLFYEVLQGHETYQGFYAKAKGDAAQSLGGLLKTW